MSSRHSVCHCLCASRTCGDGQKWSQNWFKGKFTGNKTPFFMVTMISSLYPVTLQANSGKHLERHPFFLVHRGFPCWIRPMVRIEPLSITQQPTINHHFWVVFPWFALFLFYLLIMYSHCQPTTNHPFWSIVPFCLYLAIDCSFITTSTTIDETGLPMHPQKNIKIDHLM